MPVSAHGAGDADTSFTTETLLAQMDMAAVDKAVLLQGPFYGEWNDYVARACREHPERYIGTGFLDPWVPDAKEAFNSLAEKTGLRGVKLECSEKTGLLGLHPGSRLDSRELSWLWATLEETGWTLTLDLGPMGSGSYQSIAVREIALLHPGLRIVIAHLGQPGPLVDGDPESARLWREQVSLGLLPNVWFDTAGVPAYFDEEYPYPEAAAHVRAAIDLMGIGKVLWGSDVPGHLLSGTYAQLRGYLEASLDPLPSDGRALVLGANAVKAYCPR